MAISFVKVFLKHLNTNERHYLTKPHLPMRKLRNKHEILKKKISKYIHCLSYLWVREHNLICSLKM